MTNEKWNVSVHSVHSSFMIFTCAMCQFEAKIEFQLLSLSMFYLYFYDNFIDPFDLIVGDDVVSISKRHIVTRIMILLCILQPKFQWHKTSKTPTW